MQFEYFTRGEFELVNVRIIEVRISEILLYLQTCWAQLPGRYCETVALATAVLFRRHVKDLVVGSKCSGNPMNLL